MRAFFLHLYAQPDGKDEFREHFFRLRLVTRTYAQVDGIGQAEEVCIGGEFQPIGGMEAGLAGIAVQSG